MKKSLKNLFIINFAMAAVIPLTLFGIIMISALFYYTREKISEENLVLAKTVSQMIDEYLNYPVNVTSEMASAVKKGILSGDNMRRYMSSVISNHQMFEAIYIINRNGIVTDIFPEDSFLKGISMSGHPYIMNALQDNRVSWSSPFFAPVTGKLTISVASPYKTGVIVSNIKMDILQERIRKLNISITRTLFITDTNGTIVVHYEPAKVFQKINLKRLELVSMGLSGNEGSCEYYHDGIEYIGSVATVRRTGWPVVITQRTDEAFRSIRNLRNILITIVLVTLTAAVLIALYNSMKIVKPVYALVDYSRRITEGNYSSVFRDDSSFEEIVTLSDHFTRMADAVEKREILLRSNEMELRNARNYLKTVVDSLKTILISISEEGKITECNSASEYLTGMTAEDAAGCELPTVIPFMERHMERVAEAIKKGGSVEFYDTLPDREEQRDFKIVVNPLTYDKNKGAVILIDDITDIKKKDEQLKQSQKMEVIGTLTSGISHDFNNILGGILGTISLIKFKKSKGKTIEDDLMDNYLNTIEIAGNRAQALIKQLLTISRKHELKMEAMDISASISNTVKLCRNSFDKSVEIVENHNSESPYIYGDPVHLEQVILNICVNAYHAMTIMRESHDQWGGLLSISLKKFNVDSSFREVHPDAAENEYWLVSINDTGVGIRRENISRIFEPFFSTKDKEKGTGLGLSTVYNIIREHHGFISVYSENGEGSTFNIYLPVYNTSGLSEKEDEKVIPGEGLVLVVDDEDSIRSIAESMLEQCGYEVLTAANPREGLNIFQKEKSRIDLVLLDMIMPGMNGLEVFKQMIALKPDVSVLMASGFKRDERVEAAMGLGVKGFLQKPYSIEELSEKVYIIINS